MRERSGLRKLCYNSCIMPIPILQVENLVKSYGDVQAVRGVSFTVEEGEVFGLLGPNGAGKTTTVEILEGLRTPDSGRVSVCGLDPQKNPQELKHEIGAALQATSLPDKLRVIEALRLLHQFLPPATESRRIAESFRIGRKTQHFLQPTLRGAKTTTGAGDGAGQRSQSAVLRRTNLGSRSASAARNLRHHRRTAPREKNHRDDHALHRRSRTPLRSGGHCGSRGRSSRRARRGS